MSRYALESKKNDCKNCYKCIRGCPTKAISFSNNQASIIHDDCILCGKCYTLCPQFAKEIRNDIEVAKKLINSGKKVIASIAPSFLSNYKFASIQTVKKALKQLGFYDAEETAVGATIVKKVYDQMLDDNKKDIIISSCCHSVNLLIQKHYPNCLPYLADVLSPMLAHGKDLKERYPDSYVIFIGPCIAKKDEVDNDTNHFVDVALTFIELDNWLKQENIQIEAETNQEVSAKSKARLFPTTGGVLKTMDCRNQNYQYLSLSGTENIINALESIQLGNIHKCFIEMSSCAGSCINGPAISVSNKTIIEGYINISKKAGNEDFDVVEMDYKDIQKNYDPKNLSTATPSDKEIEIVLKEMGKTSKEKELNCGSCGYNTCREKAIAILQGKAVKEMCLPYLMEKAQSFSNNIVSNTPNGLMVLDESLNIQLMNQSMCNIIGVRKSDYTIGCNVTTILNPEPYFNVLDGKTMHSQKQYLSEYDKYVETTIIHDQKFHILISIMRDITKAQKDLQNKSQVVKKSIEITNDVIEKNMRTVQEIASLLGESAAETKIALLSLKDTLKDDIK